MHLGLNCIGIQTIAICQVQPLETPLIVHQRGTALNFLFLLLCIWHGVFLLHTMQVLLSVLEEKIISTVTKEKKSFTTYNATK